MAYDDLTDDEVMERAKAALHKVTRYPVGSLQRAIQWGIYDSCSSELGRRAVTHALARLAELRKGDAG